jgi:two-component system OmpR family sensor kinase
MSTDPSCLSGTCGVPGSGLGLALVRAIVARHGNQTTIRNRPSKGTKVTLRLPVEGG